MYQNDCEISMDDFNLEPMGSPFAAATLSEVLSVLEISVTSGDDGRHCDIKFPTPERYAELSAELLDQLEGVTDNE